MGPLRFARFARADACLRTLCTHKVKLGMHAQPSARQCARCTATPLPRQYTHAHTHTLQLCADQGRDHSVCVIEKGVEVGAHILSGNVLQVRLCVCTHTVYAVCDCLCYCALKQRKRH